MFDAFAYSWSAPGRMTDYSDGKNDTLQYTTEEDKILPRSWSFRKIHLDGNQWSRNCEKYERRLSKRP